MATMKTEGCKPRVRFCVKGALVATALCALAFTPSYAATNITENVTLNADTDWSGEGTVTIAEGVTLDLNGYILTVAGIDGAGGIVDSWTGAAAYERLDFIQATGTQYIDTGYKHDDTTKVDMRIEFDSVAPEWQCFYGSRHYDETPEKRFSAWLHYKNFRRELGAGGKDYTTHTVTTSTIYDIHLEKTDGESMVSTGGVKVVSLETGTATSSGTLAANDCLFAIKQYAKQYHTYWYTEFYTHAKLYSCRIYSGETLERDFVPVRRKSDGVLGLLDRANDVFYANAGTGEFEPGAIGGVRLALSGGGETIDFSALTIAPGVPLVFTGEKALVSDLDATAFASVEVAEGATLDLNGYALKVAAINGAGAIVDSLAGYERREYLQSTAEAQFIDTGYFHKDNTKVDIRVSFDTIAKTWQCIYGARNAKSNKTRFTAWLGGAKFRRELGAVGQNIDDPLAEAGVVYDIHLDKTGYFSVTPEGGETFKKDANNSDNTSPGGALAAGQTDFLFGVHELESTKDYWTSNHWAFAKLYSCKIYSGETLERDFVPVRRRSDGEPGLFDRANNVFYANAGVGTFNTGAAASVGGLRIDGSAGGAMFAGFTGTVDPAVDVRLTGDFALAAAADWSGSPAPAIYGTLDLAGHDLTVSGLSECSDGNLVSNGSFELFNASLLYYKSDHKYYTSKNGSSEGSLAEGSSGEIAAGWTTAAVTGSAKGLVSQKQTFVSTGATLDGTYAFVFQSFGKKTGVQTLSTSIYAPVAGIYNVSFMYGARSGYGNGKLVLSIGGTEVATVTATATGTTTAAAQVRLEAGKAELVVTHYNTTADSQSHTWIDDVRVEFAGGAITDTAGTAISGYDRLDYIQATGTQYIDTGYVHDDTTKVDMRISFDATPDTAWQNFYGARHYEDDAAHNKRRFNVFLSNSSPCKFGPELGQKRDGFVDYTVLSSTIYDIHLEKTGGESTVSAGGVIVASLGTGTAEGGSFDAGHPDYLLAMNQYYASNNPNWYANFHTKAKLYSCKIYSGATLERDFVPVRRKSDNVLGLLDLANGGFYANAGTGTFNEGNVVAATSGGELRVNVAEGEEASVASALRGGLKLVKIGAGTLVMSKASQGYAGGTEVQGGTLQSGATAARVFGAEGTEVAVGSAGNVDLNGNANLAAYGWTVAGGGMIVNSGADIAASLAVSGVFSPVVTTGNFAATLSDGATLDFTQWMGTFPVASPAISYASGANIALKLEPATTAITALARSRDAQTGKRNGYLLSWDAIPAGVTFSPDAATRARFRVVSETNGLRVSFKGGFCIIIK